MDTKNTVELMKNRCTGCTLCESICPTKAITMVLNQQGYYEPSVDTEKCISCGKCYNHCPVDKDCGNRTISSWYGWHKDEAARSTSTSGGAVRAFADAVLQEDGVVFGAVYSDDFRSVVFGDSDHYPMEAIQKSKYTVSNPSGIFSQVKQQLETGRQVMFTGTPCQVAGLKTYLSKQYENLIAVDFVCGGTASLRFWREHLDALEKKYGAPVSYVDFRSKRQGWGKCVLDLKFKNGKELSCREYLDVYYECFVNHYSVREICLSCPFSHCHNADVTVADFWGYRQAGITEIDKGLSLLIANTPKGEETVAKATNLEVHELDNKWSAYAVGKSVADSAQKAGRDALFALAEKTGSIEKAAQKLYPATCTSHTIKWLKLKLKR